MISSTNVGLVALFVILSNSHVRSSDVFSMNQKTYHESSNQNKAEGTCGYASCNMGKPGFLNVHMVPHTHDDVGWLKTVDQYYYGSKSGIQRASVQYILDTVIQELLKDANKRFIYVEIAFFARWWRQQNDSMRLLVKGLVTTGQLQFILGGWCMNDEASTHYNGIIDQHTLGFKFLKDNFGECGRPHVGWQIDPFGHSREQASLFAQFGFDGLFFGRLDYQDKERRLKDKTMEHMWFGSSNLGDQSSLLTGVNFNGYSPPPNFCFDVLCNDDPIMDDERLHDYNKDKKVNDFIDYVKKQAEHYTTNHIMLTMGDDFNFVDAHVNFDNMDKLIKYVNILQTNGSKVNAFYSTPNCYLYALNKANQSYTQKKDDFFPYAHRAHSFWTGYFTSRAALKLYVRETNNFFQACKQLDALANTSAQNRDLVEMLAEAMGVAQHHDAVSGTEKQAVAYDYALRLSDGISSCQQVVQDVYQKIMPLKSAKLPKQNFCGLANITRCEFTESQTNFTVTIYNPVARTVTSNIRIPVRGSGFVVVDSNRKIVVSQYIPVSKDTISIPERSGSLATGDLIFQATLPALGYRTYFVQKMSNARAENPEKPLREAMSLHNGHLKLDFDSNGHIKAITNLKINKASNITHNFLLYHSMPGNNSKESFQASGAYIFRPKEQEPVPIANSSVHSTSTVEGPIVKEIHQKFNDWNSQVVRLYKDAPYVEFEWTVGPIPINDGVGKEIVLRYNSDLNNNGKFITDSNGRELLERVRNYRPTWTLNQTEPVAGNYYPVNSRIGIQDQAADLQLTILTDRSQGGASIHDGQIELMVHRRTLFDDSLGVGEPLNETGSDGNGLIVRGKHYLILDTIENSGKLHRDLGERLYMAPILSYAATPAGGALQHCADFTCTWSGLYQQELPANVHLLTLQSWNPGSLLLRLEHFYEKNEDVQLSKPAVVSLKGLFRTFDIADIQELTLGGDQNLEDAKRLVWNVQNYGPTKSDMSSFVTPLDPQYWTVHLNPMQIRTFQVTFKNI